MKSVPGKRERVVVACVVFEVPKVIKPILEYEASKVHIIHYTDKTNDDGKIYQEFYEEVVSQIKDYSAIKEKLGKYVEIVEHAEYRTSDFQKMLMTVFRILEHEKANNKDSEIYVNVSSGTAEYISAATIATMMAATNNNGIKLFTVGTEPQGYSTHGETLLKKLYYDNGRPVGLTKLAREPREIPMFKVSVPDKVLVKGLRVLGSFDKPVTASKIIDALMDKNLMTETSDRSDGNKKNKTQTNIMKYRRRFLEKWIEDDWADKPGESSNKYMLTEDGKMIIDTFYVDDEEDTDRGGINK
jgi:predicted transcriptional regulator